MSKYFGTDGFRGEAGITLTADTGNRSRDNNIYVISKETEIGMLVETYQKLDTNAQKRLIGCTKRTFIKKLSTKYA